MPGHGLDVDRGQCQERGPGRDPDPGRYLDLVHEARPGTRTMVTFAHDHGHERGEARNHERVVEHVPGHGLVLILGPVANLAVN